MWTSALYAAIFVITLVTTQQAALPAAANQDTGF